MKSQIRPHHTFTFTYRDQSVAGELDRVPDVCPICHTACHPGWFAKEHLVERGGDLILQMVFGCPRRECYKLFVGTYVLSSIEMMTDGPYRFQLRGVYPRTPRSAEFGEEIRRCFCAIYAQASHAEEIGLDLVCGPGYRKALEFLIKDYLIGTLKLPSETIAPTAVGNCIKHHVTDPRIRSTAQRATLLGNDETHFVRQWVGKDINDLKALIRLTVNWIESELVTAAYERTLPTSSPP